eukprot:TRINITY_DN6079_c0_g1_i1.p1 TRINITY_DN6079_c0_g1~~TRINITY_DN6079_c0_g1_i1.p1  ORF type:complete len:380 (-),score=44.05 TRINITY_DN6079_c0_g1_i1:89-1174(-)
MSQTNQVSRPIKRVHFGIDVGGTLAKIVYFQPDDFESRAEHEVNQRIHEFITGSQVYGQTGRRDEKFEQYCVELKGTLHFIKFETRRIEAFLTMVRTNNFGSQAQRVGITGGGSVKFEEDFKSLFRISKIDEIGSLLKGINFLVHNVPEELYYLEIPSFTEAVPYKVNQADHYPYLVANIGSGVSILKVESETSFKRIGGSAIGGGTFLGLCGLLAGCETFEDAMKLAESGDANNVDMLVGDIYGGDLKMFNLKAETVASSFGKMVRPELRPNSDDADRAKAALHMVTNNIASIVQLQARLHNAEHKIIFSGTFLQENDLSMRSLAYSMNWWSGGKIKALFMKHKGYAGAVGAMTNTLHED